MRHVGDAYAAVIAETVQQGKDAVEAIEIDIEEHDAVINMADALSGTNYVHDEIETNQCFDWGWIEDNRAATDEAIKERPSRHDAGTRQQPPCAQRDGATLLHWPLQHRNGRLRPAHYRHKTRI